MIDLKIKDETSPLKKVIVGTAEDFGGTPLLKEAYDPKSKEHIKKGTFPAEKDLKIEIEALVNVLEKYEVEVYQPEVIENCNQIFSRDIGFVIDDKFIISNILSNRNKEILGIHHLIKDFDPDKVIKPPKEVRIEGGDVMPWNDHIFVGYSKRKDFEKYIVSRTNEKGVEFLRKTFPEKKIKALELKKSDKNPRKNALHLDCCFQPIGKNMAIMFKGGFKNKEDVKFLKRFFGDKNIISIDREEMYYMYSNIFSITPEIIISEQNFQRLNTILREKGFTVEEIPFAETAKMEGLLRCSTLPLYRE